MAGGTHRSLRPWKMSRRRFALDLIQPNAFTFQHARHGHSQPPSRQCIDVAVLGEEDHEQGQELSVGRIGWMETSNHVKEFRVEYYPERYCPDDIVLDEAPSSKGTGGACWLSSMAFAVLAGIPGIMDANISTSVRSAIELGSGVGLGGLALARARPACRVLLTDRDTDIMPSLRRNIDRFTANDRVQCACVEWSSIEAAAAGATYDVVLACDCVYRGNWKELARALLRCLSLENQESRIILVSPNHRDGLDQLMYTLAEKGTFLVRKDVCVSLGGAGAREGGGALGRAMLKFLIWRPHQAVAADEDNIYNGEDL